MDLTDSFTNRGAHDFAYDLLTGGEGLIQKVTSAKTISSVESIQRFVAACQTISAANGHPVANKNWCTLIERWLYENKFKPTQDLIEQCIEKLEKLIERDSVLEKSDIPESESADLLARLNKPTKKITFKESKGDRKSFKEITKWLNNSTGNSDVGCEFNRSGEASVYLYYLTEKAAYKLVNFPNVTWVEFTFNTSCDSDELAKALPIVLRAWKSSLKYLEIYDVYRDERGSSLNSLSECRAALGNLPVLERFTSNEMYFDNEILKNVCKNQKLEDLDLCAADITDKAIAILSKSNSLERISFSRCPKFTEKLQEKLDKSLPTMEFATISDK